MRTTGLRSRRVEEEAAMSRLVYVLNGPNLNLLGKRQPEIYGRETLADVEAECRKVAEDLRLSIRFHQSNAEHEIIDWIQTRPETRQQGSPSTRPL